MVLRDLCVSVLQKLLVHWLVNVFDLIDDQEKFHCCYFMVFHLIRSETLVSKHKSNAKIVTFQRKGKTLV